MGGRVTLGAGGCGRWSPVVTSWGSAQQLSWQLAPARTSSRSAPVMASTTYTEIGIQLHNTRIAVRLPSIRLRRPRFWRRTHKVTSPSANPSTVSSSSLESSSSSDDWIKDFHDRYNPLNTSTPARRPRQVGEVGEVGEKLNLSGVKIYEDYDDLYPVVAVAQNRVIARLKFSDKFNL